MKKKISLELNLNPIEINDALHKVREKITEENFSPKIVARLICAIENFFHNNLIAGNENNLAKIYISKRWRSLYVEASCYGHEVQSDNEEQLDIISSLNFFPTYTHRKNRNIMTYTLVLHHLSPFHFLIGAFLLAIITGCLLKNFLPTNAIDSILHISNEICGRFANLLIALTLPMVFFRVVNSIAKIGNMSLVKGKFLSIITKSLAANFIGCVLGVLGGVLFFDSLKMGRDLDNENYVDKIFDLIIDIIPRDLITPFQQGNVIQVLLMAFAVGIAMIILRRQVASVQNVFNALDIIFNKMLQWFCALIPIYIFCNAMNFILANNNFSSLSSLFLIIGLIIAAAFILSAFALLCLKFTLKINYKEFLYKTKDSLFIAFSTSSSSIAYTKGTKELIDGLNCSESIVNITFPTAMMFCKPISSFMLTIFVFFAAEMAGVTLSIAFLPLLFLLVLSIAVSIPPVIGGGIAVLPLLLGQAGISLEYIAILVIVETITGNIRTIVNLLFIHCITYYESSSQHTNHHHNISASLD